MHPIEVEAVGRARVATSGPIYSSGLISRARSRPNSAVPTTNILLERAARSAAVLATTPLKMHEAVLSPPTHPLI